MSILSLPEALASASTVKDLSAIFSSGQNNSSSSSSAAAAPAPNVINVTLNSSGDEVTVSGYQGSVTTDQIAHKVMELGRYGNDTSESRALAETLASKVFEPLKALVENPQGRCSLTHISYKVSTVSRIVWTPPPDPRFGGSIALKHAMCLMTLDGTFSTAN